MNLIRCVYSLAWRLALLHLALAFCFSHGAFALERVAAATGNWSAPATWVGGVLPGSEDDVKIPSGITVTLDADVECGGILVEGILQVQRANRTLLCDSLLVQGAGATFQAGTSASRFLENFTLTLKGLSTESPLASMGGKLLGAHNGGTLSIHGRDRIEWTRLAASAAPGATSMTLIEPVDWTVGDSILVTSSRASWDEAETRTITAVSPDMRTVSFTQGLSYLHNGNTLTRTRASDGKSWTAELRAEVGLLSRNVKIQGDAASETGGYGGHIMVMNGGSGCCETGGKAYIEGVELFRMGQKSLLARYPMHWHMLAGEGAGQYFRDNVVRHSFNRAITIHGTESTLVENNFCYDHLGHGIFLENGSERYNVIRKNVVALSRKPAPGEEILQTDNGFSTPQNQSPSSFWITNPNNTFTDNVAAGTEGTGYWFAFPRKPLGPSLNDPRFAGLEPYKEPLGAFDRNAAHSCQMGIDTNDQVNADDTLRANGEWANDGPFYFNDCTWYSNKNAVYAGIGGGRKNVVYHNHVFCDNELNLFLATYHLCEESLMVADSGFGLQPPSTLRTIYAVYDGAGRMTKNHIVGYDATNARFLNNIGASAKHPNHYFENLTFDPPTPVRSVLTNYNIIPPPDIGANDPGHPRVWGQVIVDVDGSITGVPGSSIVSNHPLLLTGGETRPLEWTNMYRSDHRFAHCRLSYDLPSSSIPNVSIVRTKEGTPTRGIYYINGFKDGHQMPLIVRGDFLYTYTYEALPTSRKVNVNFTDAVPGDDSLIRFKDFGKLPGIAVTGMTSQPSLAALKAATTSGFFKENNGDFYIRPVATAANQLFTISWTSGITMPPVDSDGDGTNDPDEAAAGTDPFRTVDGTEPLVNSEFSTDGNFEQWDSFVNITNAAVTGGALLGQASPTNGDSRMIQNYLRIPGSDTPYLLVRMKASANGSAELFWGNLVAPGISAERMVKVNYNASSVFQVLAFPMLNHAAWAGNVITSLRFDPVTSAGVAFEIDSIRGSTGELISTLPAQTIVENTSTGPLDFVLSDDIFPQDSHVVTGTSSNPALVPNGNIVITGSGANRSVTVTPAPNMTGTATITLSVTVGTLTSTSDFTLTVNPAPVAPAYVWLDSNTKPLGGDGASLYAENNWDDDAIPGTQAPAAGSINPSNSTPAGVAAPLIVNNGFVAGGGSGAGGSTSHLRTNGNALTVSGAGSGIKLGNPNNTSVSAWIENDGTTGGARSTLTVSYGGFVTTGQLRDIEASVSGGGSGIWFTTDGNNGLAGNNSVIDLIGGAGDSPSLYFASISGTDLFTAAVLASIKVNGTAAVWGADPLVYEPGDTVIASARDFNRIDAPQLQQGASQWFSTTRSGYALTLVFPGYSAWASANAPSQSPELDFDNDGVANGIEWVLGGSATTNDAGKLPTLSLQNGDFVFSFVRHHVSKTADTAVSIQTGSDLTHWTGSFPVPDSGVLNEVEVIDNGNGTDTVTLTLPQGADSRKFARLNVALTAP